VSGGSGSLDAQYKPIPKPSPERHNSGLFGPKRVEIDETGKKKFFFDCARCGNEFEANRGRPRTYCSSECRKAAFGELASSRKGVKRTAQERENMSKGQKKAWQNPAVKSARIQGMHRNPRGKNKKKRPTKGKQYSHTCSHCGTSFKNKRKQQKYCSRKCAGKSQRRGETHRCANPDCSDAIYRKRHHIEKGERKYCSMKCAKDDPAYWDGILKTRKERYGRDWEWQGWEQKRTDPQIWDPLAAKIRKQDDDTCQSCNRRRKSDENQFPVHHILPWSKGGPDEGWNLITLCPSCHPKTDAQGGPVRYPHESQSKLDDFFDSV
jgi:hypothetical protein